MSKKEAWGIFRPDKRGQWELLNDETHQSFGISSVSQTDEFVQINYEIPFKMIHWAAVTPDEKMKISSCIVSHLGILLSLNLNLR